MPREALRTVEVPRECLELAKRRTSFLLYPPGLSAWRHDLTLLLACAYMQGLSDADEALGHPTPPPAPEVSGAV